MNKADALTLYKMGCSKCKSKSNWDESICEVCEQRAAIEALENEPKPEVVYCTEYIIEPSQFLKKEDGDKLRAEFIEGLKTGVAIAWPSYKVQAHQQPTAIIMPDGNIVKLR